MGRPPAAPFPSWGKCKIEEEVGAPSLSEKKTGPSVLNHGLVPEFDSQLYLNLTLDRQLRVASAAGRGSLRAQRPQCSEIRVLSEAGHRISRQTEARRKVLHATRI